MELTAQLGLVAARDPGSTRLVYAIVIVLALGGIALAWFAWWLLKTTRPDPELLAPLEAIEGRRWRRLDPAGRRRLLDELRPEGAEPLDPARHEPTVDDEFRDDLDLRDVRDLSGADSVAQGSSAVSDGSPAFDAPAAGSPMVPGEPRLWSELPPPRGDDWADWDERLGVGQPIDEPDAPEE